MNRDYIKAENQSADELQKLGHTLQGQSNGMAWVKLSSGELVSGLDYESILKKVKPLTLNIGKWTHTVNHHMIEYAKKNGYKYFNDIFFRLNIVIDNTIYIIDTYKVVDDELIVTLTE